MLSLPPVLSLRAQVATARGRCHCTRKVSLREEGVIAGPDPQSSAFRLPGCRIKSGMTVNGPTMTTPNFSSPTDHAA